MKRAFLAGFVALPLLTHPVQSDAFVVECANCATAWQQLTNYAKQIQQYSTEVAQLQNALAMKANMITNTISLPQQAWAQVQGDIYQVRSIASAASVLTGNQGSILTRLQSAQGYANQAGYMPQNMTQQFAMWQQTLGRAGTLFGQTLGVQQGQENSYTAVQAAIQAHSQTAAGQMQAIQAGVEMAALTNTQLQQIQTTLTAQSQMQASKMLVDADRQAQEDAAEQAFVSGPNVPTTGYQGF